MPGTTPTTTPAPAPTIFNNDDHQDVDIFGHDWWKKSLWITGGVMALGVIVFICWLAFSGGDTNTTGNSTILPIAAFVMLLAIGAIVALVVSFLLNRRSISAGKVIGVIGGVLAIMFLFVLIAYIFPGFGRAMGFSTPSPADPTTTSAKNVDIPPQWIYEQVDKPVELPAIDLDPMETKAMRSLPTDTEVYWKTAQGTWAVYANGHASSGWFGTLESPDGGSLGPGIKPGASFSVQAGKHGLAGLVLSWTEKETEKNLNPDWVKWCEQFDCTESN